MRGGRGGGSVEHSLRFGRVLDQHISEASSVPFFLLTMPACRPIQVDLDGMRLTVEVYAVDEMRLHLARDRLLAWEEPLRNILWQTARDAVPTPAPLAWLRPPMQPPPAAAVAREPAARARGGTATDMPLRMALRLSSQPPPPPPLPVPPPQPGRQVRHGRRGGRAIRDAKALAAAAPKWAATAPPPPPPPSPSPSPSPPSPSPSPSPRSPLPSPWPQPRRRARGGRVVREAKHKTARIAMLVAERQANYKAVQAAKKAKT